MKICMIVHKNYYADPRVKRYVNSLLNLGVSVDVICISEHDGRFHEKLDLLTVHTISLGHHHSSRTYYLFEYGLAFIFYFFKLTLLHLKNHYDVIHIHNAPDFLVFTALLPKLSGARIILDIHDPMPELYLTKFGGNINGFISRAIQFQEKISCSMANSVITVNSMVRANLEKRGIPASKIRVVKNVPSLLLFDRRAYTNQRHLTKDSFILIYPGTLAPRYGLEISIKALVELIPKIPQICLVIIGGGNSSYKETLVQLAHQLGVISHVQFCSPVPVEEIPCILAGADVGIYPALCSPHMNIATPTKVLEYAYMGIPIIASRLSILEDLFGNSAIKYFEPGNDKHFAECVLELFETPALREELVRNADRVCKQENSWEDEFKVYISTINQLLPDNKIGGSKDMLEKNDE
jgi:glycosyltransferase involved in cell wall biosynthesis